MTGLSETVRRLAAARVAPRPAEGPSRLSRLSGFGANPGALGAWTYIPADLPSRAPLVVVLHGCTQTAAGYDRGSGWSRLADEGGFALLFPEQTRANNHNTCFNWFVPGDTLRGGGEIASILAMVAHVAAIHDVDPARVYVTGLSAGGAMSAALLAAAPDVFAGGAIIAGLPSGIASTVPQAFERMRGQGLPDAETLQRRVRSASQHDGPWPTLSIWQGDADRTVDTSNADAIFRQWRGVHGVGPTPTRSEAIGAHQRRTWTDSAGRDVIESVTLSGMGHGTPIGGGDGVAAPYMLDVGVSSSRHVARFWGLSVAAPRIVEPVRPRHDAPLPRSRARAAAPKASNGTSRPPGVTKTIEDALRAAGLLH